MGRRFRYLENEGIPSKPMFTPDQNIEKGLFTAGKEWMTMDDEEWIGLYHAYPNGARYTQPSLNDLSVKLQPYSSATEPATLVDNPDAEKVGNNSIYFKLTGARFSNYEVPRYFYPQPNEQDYEQKHIQRYFAQKINNPNDITEIDQQSFDNFNKKNKPGIDAGIYRSTNVMWTIAGPIEEVRKVNLRVRELAGVQLPGLDKFLSELDEYHKDSYLVKQFSPTNSGTNGPNKSGV